ncbi:hypothetical protein S7711_07833 [Stachybotrys chartarum IBT 7711]|uniref:Golgi apparatus membrane protein TVP38 n=1 Tax=Stachybotrys chartarum (strain CBS 109288 / IBT 7711) TaxID=1280523 RepID=A0A084AQQ7_STACB|nr:hypothetical protein S7711_07833 [Stachybotrys chartarum IBT 7711]
MVSDEHYELALPVLQNPSLEDEDKTDRLEEIFREKTTLTGSSLENAILDSLWRYREAGGNSASPPPIRQTILRRPSPASWRGSPTPLSGSPRLGVSPLAPPGFVPSTFNRTISSTASPFSSPRASPRLAFASPAIPHSPNLNAYEFSSDSTPAIEILGEYQTDNVEWLVNDDAVSVSSSVGTASGLNAAAPEFSSMSAQQVDMSPYDILRSILGQSRTDDEIEAALAVNGYDLSATIVSIMENQGQDGGISLLSSEEPKSVLIGKSLAANSRPTTPVSQQKSGVICKFYMSTGQCLRADCRFSHDLSNHLCKYWIMGNCLAGETCIFSHDPSKLVNKLSLDGASTPPTKGLHIQDLASFPSLQPGTPDGLGFMGNASFPGMGMTPPPGLRGRHGTESPRSRSRPGSRHQGKEAGVAAPAFDDNEAFPSLGSVSVKQGKKHHGKRGGHGHGHKENSTPNSMADVVKMSPSPTPGSPRLETKRLGRNGSSGSSAGLRNGENSAAAQAIPSPKHVPWLETGDRANKAYLKARQEAIKHGGLRNKFLQRSASLPDTARGGVFLLPDLMLTFGCSAAQAWNRNDARAAKALSLRGQSENDLMRKAHREAARELYEERNKISKANSTEMYVDLHGLHPEEAVEYLEKVLMENGKESRPIYAITGTGHHSKNGKDKVGKAIRNFLNEWRYAYREFSVPGDRNNMGGILGIDARSWDKSLAREESPDGSKGGVDILSEGVEIGDGKTLSIITTPPGASSLTTLVRTVCVYFISMSLISPCINSCPVRNRRMLRHQRAFLDPMRVRAHVITNNSKKHLSKKATRRGHLPGAMPWVGRASAAAPGASAKPNHDLSLFPPLRGSIRRSRSTRRFYQPAQPKGEIEEEEEEEEEDAENRTAMPADYHSAAQALAVSPSRTSSSPPPWSRRHSESTARRLEGPPRRASARTTVRRLVAAASALNQQVIGAYMRLSPLQRLAAVVASVVVWTLIILVIVYSHAFFSWLAPVAKTWRENPFGWLVIFGLIFVMSFPPVIGYSTVNTIAGFVYGFPLGWPIIASACVVGSFAAFMASRTVLSSYVDRMVGHDHRFRALGQVLRKEGILYLTAIRLCPLPFSLSNGFLATIPTITPAAFALSTALSTPKLLVHVFVGSRLAILAEKGDEMTAGDKAINWLSMVVGGAIGIGTGLIIYRRTMARAAEIAREDNAAAAEDGDAGYEDSNGPLLDPEDAAAIMSDDDVSLWEANAGSYHDADGSTDDDVQLKSPKKDTSNSKDDRPISP